ncbi:MAG: hypothetical protein LH630_01585 [Actinomycetia bacterium]|nr:hypothetical protein [Actinomycetes bacterium]
MSTLEILGWFLLLPVIFFVVISLLVYTPSWVRGPKYRPGLSWWAEPIWIGGRDLEVAAQAEPVREGGGCSARW